MRPFRVGAVAVTVVVLVAATARLLGWPLERAALLAPVLVVAAAAAAGLVILWGKVAVQSLRETKRPRLVLALWLLGLGLLVLLSVLGVELPREG